MSISREKAIDVLKDCPKKYLEAAAVVAETQPVQGDWGFDGEESFWEDETGTTLANLANEFRKLAHATFIEKVLGKRVTKRANKK